jgi:hypothetical protein
MKNKTTKYVIKHYQSGMYLHKNERTIPSKRWSKTDDLCDAYLFNRSQFAHSSLTRSEQLGKFKEQYGIVPVIVSIKEQK